VEVLSVTVVVLIDRISCCSVKGLVPNKLVGDSVVLLLIRSIDPTQEAGKC